MTSKAKSTRNPLYKWNVGRGAVNGLAFSPCGHYLAAASQDGHLRLFDYDAMELTGTARSYFGGVTCVCWSPDGRYVAFGAEDDLVTVYSVNEKAVVLRGQGHKSWVSGLAFDAFNVSYGEVPDGLDFSGSDEEDAAALMASSPQNHHRHHRQRHQGQKQQQPQSDDGDRITCYRLGSVGEDTLLCLWDLTEDLLRKASSSAAAAAKSGALSTGGQASPDARLSSSSVSKGGGKKSSEEGSSEKSSLSQRLASLNFGEKREHKRNFSFGGRDKDKGKDKVDKGGNQAGAATMSSSSALSADVERSQLGSAKCPRLSDVPLVEPVVSKKVARERLTSLAFLEDSFVTACQDGYLCVWERPELTVMKVTYRILI